MRRIDTIAPGNAAPEVEALYQEIKQAFGMIPNLFKTYAHHPPLLEANWHKVKRVMMEGVLSRKAKESIALLVSSDNGCRYCVAAHSGALKALGTSAEEIARIETDLDAAEFSAKERSLIRFARRANRAALEVNDAEFAALRQVGASDAEIIEALGVMEVFTAFNRFLDVLDVELG